MRTALVVDDSRAMRMIVTKLLRELGFEVLEARNGLEALGQLAPPREVDLILADWNMPEMDGLELVRRLRTIPAYSRVPVMMVTTESEVGQISAALEAGANEYVMKPFTKEILVDKLRLAGVSN